MSTEIAERQPYDRETNQLMVLAQQAFASGLFKALKSPAEAFIRMAVAKEMGLGPTTGLRAIYLVNGVPAFSAGFMAARVKSSRRYNYKVAEKTALKCRLEWFEMGEPIGHSEFTMEMGKRAGLISKDVWKSFPESMLFARALTDGVRTFCPDVMMGHNAYTTEELGAEATADDLPASATVVEKLVEKTEPVEAVSAAPTAGEIWDLIRLKGADVVTILRTYGVEKIDDLNPDQKKKLKTILMFK